jgi:hypothetical protein
MKIALTGWGGFLATKLREHTEIEWTETIDDADILVIMGGPTFTDAELHEHDAQVIHQYVRQTIKMVDRFFGTVVFASTTGVDDIQLDHKGSTAYNLGKLYLENYIINNCPSHLILRIGTIVSNNASDVDLMKLDRIQQRIRQKDYSNIDFEDYYLDVNVFVNHTIDALQQSKNGILTYPLTKITLPELIKLEKQ